MHSYTKKFGWPFWGGKILALGQLYKFKGDLNLTLIYNFVPGDDFFLKKWIKINQGIISRLRNFWQ